MRDAHRESPRRWNTILEQIFLERPRARSGWKGCRPRASPLRRYGTSTKSWSIRRRQSAEMFPTLEHPTAGPHRVTGTPVKLSGNAGTPGAPAPVLGQHTDRALAGTAGTR